VEWIPWSKIESQLAELNAAQQDMRSSPNLTQNAIKKMGEIKRDYVLCSFARSVLGTALLVNHMSSISSNPQEPRKAREAEFDRGLKLNASAESSDKMQTKEQRDPSIISLIPISEIESKRKIEFRKAKVKMWAGRCPTSDIVLMQPEADLKRHARLHRRHEKFKICDKSKAGTFVNGTRIRRDTWTELHEGDVLSFGSKSSASFRVSKKNA